MANREIKTKVAIDGEKEYKESLKNIIPVDALPHRADRGAQERNPIR